MSIYALALHRSFQSQFVPPQQAERRPRQLDLPLQGLRILRIVARWLTPRRRCARIVYFGKGKYVAIGSAIRRVEPA